MELTLLCLDVELVLQESLKNFVYMLRDRLGENQNVVNIHKHKFVKHIIVVRH